MSRHVVNPFFYETPTDRWSFTDREDLTGRVVGLMHERARRALVFGRRRQGKTSLLKNAGAKAKRPFVYCDISKAASLPELARKILDAAPPEKGVRLAQALEIASKYLKSVAVKAGKIVLSGELRPSDAAETLEGVLNTLNERAAENDEVWNICLDEFQEIRTLGGDKIDWRVRGITQEHRALNYFFTGSDQRIVHWMTEPHAPFFKQMDQIEVGPIEPRHLGKWIEERAKIGGISPFPFGEKIVAAAGPCTGDIVRLAKAVFNLAPSAPSRTDLVARAFDAIALVELGSEFGNRWRGLVVNQRSVLRAIADGRPPVSAETLRDYGIAAASTASTAIETLVDRQVLVRDGARVIFDSPFFCRWVAANGEQLSV